MFPTCSLWTDEIRGLCFVGEVLMRVLTPERLVDVSRKQTHMQTHADHVCHAAWLLESHERRISTEWGNSWRTMPGESAAGNENEQPSYRSWQVQAQAGLCEGLCWPGEGYGVAGGFLSIKIQLDTNVKVWQATGNRRNNKRGHKGIPPHTSLKRQDLCN